MSEFKETFANQSSIGAIGQSKTYSNIIKQA